MKTAISIPDEIFEAAERLARRLKISRSELYSRAISEFVTRHATERVTETMDEALAKNRGTDRFVCDRCHAPNTET